MADAFVIGRLAGGAACLAAKMLTGRPPGDFDPPDGRHERAALRIALRQKVRLAEHANDTDLSQLAAAWRAVFDIPRMSDEADDEAPGH